MENSVFGNAGLVEAMQRFAASEQTVAVPMLHAEAIDKFVNTIQEAHEKTRQSVLRFG